MPSIKFNPDAFRSATRDYTREDYTKGVNACFWRELLQNSRDALASRVDITVTSENNIYTVVFQDNGKGMSKEVLENGMLTYAGSIKSDGAAGGFGMAKCLLVFAPTSCQIDTGELSVYVQGIDYDYIPSTEKIDGTRFTIVIDNNGFTVDKQITPTIEGLKFLLERSNMNGMRVTCNGTRIYDTILSTPDEPIRKWEDYKTFAYHLKRETPVKNADGNNVLVVQHRGIWVMDYTLSEEVKGAVWVNIEDDATKVLNASRVGIASYGLRNAIGSFMNELAQAPKAAVQTKKFVKRWDGQLNKVEKKETAEKLADDLIFAKQRSNNPEQSVKEWVKEHSYIVANLFKPEGTGTIPTAELDTDRLILADVDSYDMTQQLLTLSHSPAFMLVNDREGEVDRAYLPETMGARQKQILAVWSEMIKQLLLLTRSFGVTYGVGFIFSEDARAEWRKDTSDNTVWFLLNPVDDKGELRFSLSDSKSRSEMISTVTHEVAHELTEDNYHGDRFASKITDLTSLVLDNLQFFNAIWKNRGK